MTVPIPGLVEPDPAPDGAPEAPRRAPAGLARVAPVVALVGLVLVAVGLVIGLRPLRTPIQDCGTSFGFLLDGRLDQFGDPDNPPRGTTEAQVQAANDTPCQERAAHRALPALVLIVAGTLVGLLAAATEAIWRTARRRSAPAAHEPVAVRAP